MHPPRHSPLTEPDPEGWRAASCTGKEAFTELRHARAAARRRPGRSPYRCQHCQQWHIGSRKH